MKVSLICHRDMPSSVRSIDVTIEASPQGGLWLRYHVDALLGGLALPDPMPPDRTNGLWQSTCFELFARDPGRPGYDEFNFSPSSRWAAYRFTGHRDGRSDLALDAAPVIGLDASEEHFAMEVELAPPIERRGRSLNIGLSAVIEQADGAKSYWALRHPPGKPDFHHPDCFALTLPAPGET